MNVLTMTSEEMVNNSMKWIKLMLMENYRLSEQEADWAMERSRVREIYSQDVEMSSHDSIEEWTAEVYRFWKTQK